MASNKRRATATHLKSSKKFKTDSTELKKLLNAATLLLQKGGVIADLFGYKEGFKAKQIEVIASLLQGHQVLANFATGFGKSAIYLAYPLVVQFLLQTQAPAESKRRRKVIIVQPLLALIDEQRAKLQLIADTSTDIKIVPVAIHADATDQDWKAIRTATHIFCTPEMLLAKSFKEIIVPLGDQICLCTFDEADCIDQWLVNFLFSPLFVLFFYPI